MVESPVVMLTNAILLSALSKRAERIRIDGDGRACVVTFLIDGAEHEEIRPPKLLRGAIVRRIGVMASLPMYPKGGSAVGEIRLSVEARPDQPRFAVRVSGHGEGLTATLDVLDGYAR